MKLLIVYFGDLLVKTESLKTNGIIKIVIIFFYWDVDCNEIIISLKSVAKAEGVVYFPSYEIAERALEEIVKPFIKEHPEFVW